MLATQTSANTTVERTSQQATLVGALRATCSGCPSLPRHIFQGAPWIYSA